MAAATPDPRDALLEEAAHEIDALKAQVASLSAQVANFRDRVAAPVAAAAGEVVKVRAVANLLVNHEPIPKGYVFDLPASHVRSLGANVEIVKPAK